MKKLGTVILLAALLSATGCRTATHAEVWEYKTQVIYLTLGDVKHLDKSLNDLCRDGWNVVSLSTLEPLQGTPSDSPKAVVILKKAKQ